MDVYELSAAKVEKYRQFLLEEERSELTIQKYLRDIRAFLNYIGGETFARGAVLDYKQSLIKKYKPASINSMLAALNGFFAFCRWPELKVKPLKIQRNMFAEPERELSPEEYSRLVYTAKNKKNERLYLLMQTICTTGIRVSELKFITVEAVRNNRADVMSKGKRRTVFITPKLKKLLLAYAKQQKIKSGHIFISRYGNPLSRHRIWSDMKALCELARVDSRKVFPHNLRHLFARTFYSLEKDLGRLADILGHSNINTTRIYTMESGREHYRILNNLSLIFL